MTKFRHVGLGSLVWDWGLAPGSALLAWGRVYPENLVFDWF